MPEKITVIHQCETYETDASAIESGYILIDGIHYDLGSYTNWPPPDGVFTTMTLPLNEFNPNTPVYQATKVVE